MPAAGPVATIVAATRNRAALLPRLVQALEAQEGAPPFEVVIVDDASTDDTPEVLAKLAASASIPLRTIRHDPRRGPGPARNAGWRSGTAPLVLFTDDDCTPRPTWVAELVDALADHDVAQGATTPAPDQLSQQGTFSRTLEVSEATGFFQTCNMGYRRYALEAVDGFDEAFDHPAGEDTDLALRCLAEGCTFEFRAAAIVEHDVRPSSLVAAVRDTWRWQGVVGVVKKHPAIVERLGSRWFWKPSHPPLLLAALGLAVLAASHGALGRSVGLALGGPYLRYRLLVDPVHPGRAGRIRYLGHAAAVDAGEVVAMARGSMRYGRLYL
jgi:glycosyltransferase involved in cell wall biosynthesis